MRTFRDAKAIARTLRQGLAKRNIDLSHGECLEVVAEQFGFRDWNTLSARIGGPALSPLTMPKDWLASGSKPDHYDMGIDPKAPGGPAVIRCRFLADDPLYGSIEGGFGTMMQSIFADAFKGRMIRLAAELKAEDVSGAGTIWMRIERGPGQVVGFDNMEERSVQGPLRGTVDWTQREVVLDVPEDAVSIHYGFYLRGTGTLSARRFSVAETGADAAVTAKRKGYLDRPTNLDFVSAG